MVGQPCKYIDMQAIEKENKNIQARLSFFAGIIIISILSIFIAGKLIYKHAGLNNYSSRRYIKP
jgi:hypothetical protein